MKTFQKNLKTWIILNSKDEFLYHAKTDKITKKALWNAAAADVGHGI